MLEEVFGNLYILIPIAIVIALRILEARKKQAQERNFQRRLPARPGPEAVDNPSGGEDEFTPFGAPGAGPANWILAEDAAGRSPSSPVEPELLVAASLGTDASGGLKPGPLPGAVKTDPPADRGPFQGLDRLPPLKRAVALTEILGTPQGLR
jgi:hypothetical protein